MQLYISDQATKGGLCSGAASLRPQACARAEGPNGAAPSLQLHRCSVGKTEPKLIGSLFTFLNIWNFTEKKPTKAINSKTS